jgi:nitrogen-specific signal transduction histidine kinase
VRKALVRNDGREGGIMLIIKREFENEVKNAIESIGIPVEIWDNGSPF